MPFVVSDVGEVSNVDTIAQAAEELLRLEGVTAVAVFGEKDGVYHVSGRSRDDRVHMGHALDLAVSELVDGAAGGHARMGGGQIPVGAVGSEADRANLADRLFTAMNGEEA
jgi:nanoRNase/pAp phosphatase (c-di-AMP/oligoRNAs hydrolase)